MTKTKKRLAIIITSALVVTLGAGFLYWNCILVPERNEKVLQRQERKINYELEPAARGFKGGITLVEEKDAQGKPHYVGVLSYELDAILEDLVVAYNADPLTTRPITEDKLRYFLTEGLAEVTEVGETESPFMDFIFWTKHPADLVYAYDTPDAGFVAGTKVESHIYSNFDYYSNPEDCPQYTPPPKEGEPS